MENNGGLIVIIIVLLVALLGICGYVAYDKGLIFNKEEENTEENKENENIEEESSNESDYISLEIKDENCKNDSTANYSVRSSMDGISATVNNDNSVYLVINNNNYSSEVMTRIVNNFSQNVVDVLVSGIGQDSSGGTIVFLMEDGTLEYIPLYKAIQSGNIESYGKLEEVEGVVKLYTVSAQPKGSPIGGYLTILA